MLKRCVVCGVPTERHVDVTVTDTAKRRRNDNKKGHAFGAFLPACDAHGEEVLAAVVENAKRYLKGGCGAALHA